MILREIFKKAELETYSQVMGKYKRLIDNAAENEPLDGSYEIFSAFESLHDGDESEYLQYFYHSDHLGSSSFITDAAGYAEQHIQYLPFGELFVSQRNTSFDSRNKFTARACPLRHGGRTERTECKLLSYLPRRGSISVKTKLHTMFFMPSGMKYKIPLPWRGGRLQNISYK